MRWLFTLLAALALASNASAHYIFIKFQKFTDYQYIRKNTNNNSPVTGNVPSRLCPLLLGASHPANRTLAQT